MKVQLGVRLTPSSYYQMNIDPATQPGENDRIACQNLNDLSSLIDTNELEEFSINNTFEYLPLQAYQQVFNHWLSLLAHNGLLIVTGTDYRELSRQVFIGDIDLNKFLQLTYGLGKKSMVFPDVIIQLLTQSGQFNIESVKYDNEAYIIKARRK